MYAYLGSFASGFTHEKTVLFSTVRHQHIPEIRFTFSIEGYYGKGIVSETLKQADKLLYQAKKQRDCLVTNLYKDTALILLIKFKKLSVGKYANKKFQRLLIIVSDSGCKIALLPEKSVLKYRRNKINKNLRVSRKIKKADA